MPELTRRSPGSLSGMAQANEALLVLCMGCPCPAMALVDSGRPKWGKGRNSFTGVIQQPVGALQQSTSTLNSHCPAESRMRSPGAPFLMSRSYIAAPKRSCRACTVASIHCLYVSLQYCTRSPSLKPSGGLALATAGLTALRSKIMAPPSSRLPSTTASIHRVWAKLQQRTLPPMTHATRAVALLARVGVTLQRCLSAPTCTRLMWLASAAFRQVRSYTVVPSSS
mmetsp:Transcript_2568/g.5422  ORF Transcript_2568/g.5422 Transcript_2568/m.5422 type:complete len:225 (-) Transcript_2568:130-804(-)